MLQKYFATRPTVILFLHASRIAFTLIQSTDTQPASAKGSLQCYSYEVCSYCSHWGNKCRFVTLLLGIEYVPFLKQHEIF